MKVCIYLRKSRADRDHPEMPPETVLKNHEAILMAYAFKANLDVIEIKKEIVSGESLARRPEMLQLLDEVEDGRYDAVLVKDFDRLGRGNMMEQGIIIEAFRKSGTKIITPEKTYDLENEFDEEYIDISAFFARKELKMITKRLQSGRAKSVSDGNYISPYSPYGYDKVQKTLKVNEKEKPVVELIFDLYINRRYGDRKIARYLTDCGIPGKHGAAIWDKTTIRNILRNPVYTGKIVWNKRVYRYSAAGKRTSCFRESSKWKIYSGKHEAIISTAVFEQAQRIAREHAVPHLSQSKQLRNPMAGLLRCGACGGSMTMRTASGKADTLRCGKQCGGSAGSYFSLIEEKLMTLLSEFLSDYKLMFRYADENPKGFALLELPALAQSLDSLRSDKIKVLTQKSSLHDLLEQGIYDHETFLDRSIHINETLSRIENRILAVKSLISSQKDIQSRGRQDVCYCPDESSNLQDFIRDVYGKLDPKNKNEFLKEFIDTIVYKKTPGSEKDGFTLNLVLKD